MRGSKLVSEKSVAAFSRATKARRGVKSSGRSIRPCSMPKSSDSLPSVAPTNSQTKVRTPAALSAIKPRGMYLACTDSSEPSHEGIELNSSFQKTRSGRTPDNCGPSRAAPSETHWHVVCHPSPQGLSYGRNLDRCDRRTHRCCLRICRHQATVLQNSNPRQPEHQKQS